MPDDPKLFDLYTANICLEDKFSHFNFQESLITKLTQIKPSLIKIKAIFSYVDVKIYANESSLMVCCFSAYGSGGFSCIS